ncbi:AAA family ATPase [Qipengyuania qiaonensis]|uniref:AAA family ATPase n=1 Tax=Qipengyuania qiaonensis TaxID=2867240 RepID=A0ABS7JDM6_9SPHN|nr:AAA family ATPase [Qipengyuania qiaonensis]MBX7484050.1 AAA family ATPase [Qipengyuania qiaonensis]
MKILITGMSGTGKSTAVKALRAAGTWAIDLDADGYSEWRPFEGNPTGSRDGFDWVWSEEKLRSLLSQPFEGPRYFAGCAPNIGDFLNCFDEVVLLSAPIETMLFRVARRTANEYGKSGVESARIVENTRNVEPLLRSLATVELETDRPLEEVVADLLSLARNEEEREKSDSHG